MRLSLKMIFDIRDDCLKVSLEISRCSTFWIENKAIAACFKLPTVLKTFQPFHGSFLFSLLMLFLVFFGVLFFLLSFCPELERSYFEYLINSQSFDQIFIFVRPSDFYLF